MKNILKFIICFLLMVFIMSSSVPNTLAIMESVPIMPNKVTMDYNVELTNIVPKILSDIKGHWAEKTIQALFDKGIISGDNGKFIPQKTITRAEFVTLMVKVMGYTPSKNTKYRFTDISKHWAKTAIETALDNKILVVTDWGKCFYPNLSITREQMTIIMARALKLSVSAGKNPFADKVTNGLIIKAYELGLISGSTSNGKLYFKPKNTATKAESATIIYKILQYKENPAPFLDNEAKQKSWMNSIEDGVSDELLSNVTGLEGGKTVQECNKYANDKLKDFTGWMKKCNISDVSSFKKEFVRVGKAWVMASYNRNYTQIEQFKSKANEFWAPINVENYLNRNMEQIISNKVVMEGIFRTGEGLIVMSNQRPVLRGTVKYRYRKPTNYDVLKKDICGETGKVVEYDKWYEEDIEVTFDPEDGLKVSRINNVSHSRLARK